MSAPFSLLKHVGKAFLKHLVKSGGNAVGLGFGGDMLVDAWEGWAGQRDEAGRRADVEALARANAAEIRRMAEAVVAEVAAGQSPALRQTLATFLTLTPSTIRQSLRRHSDPSGATASSLITLRRPEDLLRLLPSKLPRFKPGDRPLRAVDWELVELLGVGGFGEVWKARNPHFDGVAPVALKFCTDPGAKDRLLKHEAAVLNQVMRQARHPGIVQLQQTYLAADPPCLAYEYVAGGDLAGCIQDSSPRGGIPPRQAARIVQGLAEVVGFAHRLSPPVVHRDLKPANILVQRTPGGQIAFRVADFGVGGLATSGPTVQTRAGGPRHEAMATVVLGTCTPLYASPQQARGAPPDTRDDVHALGVIWYQMMTGDLTAGVPGGIQWTEDLRRRGMEDKLIQLLASCMESRAEHRPANAAILAQQLHQLIASPEPTPSAGSSSSGAGIWRVGNRWTRRHPKASVGLLLGATLALALSLTFLLKGGRSDLQGDTQHPSGRSDPPKQQAAGQENANKSSGNMQHPSGKSESPSPDTPERGKVAQGRTGLEVKRARRGQRWRMTGEMSPLILARLGMILAVPEPDGRYLVVAGPEEGPSKGKVHALDRSKYLAWEYKPEGVRNVAKALGLKDRPDRILLFFSEELENRLLRLELDFADRKEEDIGETVFVVLSLGGQRYVVRVSSQKAKK